MIVLSTAAGQHDLQPSTLQLNLIL